MKNLLIYVVISILVFGASVAYSLSVELTKAQAIARVRAILRNNTGGCRINKIKSVSASKVKAGWRVTGKIIMSASGSPISETVVWIVSERNGTVAQSQIAAEISNGCP